MMGLYRLFWLGPSGRFASVDELEADADETAIRRALASSHPHGCEVWAGPATSAASPRLAATPPAPRRHAGRRPDASAYRPAA
jgi:hypothetical protein